MRFIGKIVVVVASDWGRLRFIGKTVCGSCSLWLFALRFTGKTVVVVACDRLRFIGKIVCGSSV